MRALIETLKHPSVLLAASFPRVLSHTLPRPPGTRWKCGIATGVGRGVVWVAIATLVLTRTLADALHPATHMLSIIHQDTITALFMAAVVRVYVQMRGQKACTAFIFVSIVQLPSTTVTIDTHLPFNDLK